ncbi:MAG: thiamine biosynthesis protein ThiS [Deltaproteobacteria bacterium]|jgi:sulfur carrier protein|nr:thiamine biosynthesis protein ThiS [Deltaproteobacteria bacterium]
MQASHEIQVNGEPLTVPAGSTVADLVEQLALGGRKIAVAVNRDVVPKSHFGRRRIEAADRVEILEAVGGG